MKKLVATLVGIAAAAVAFTASSEANATSYVVYVHGRSQTYWSGNTCIPVASRIGTSSAIWSGPRAAGDHVYTLSFVPSSIPALAAFSGQIRPRRGAALISGARPLVVSSAGCTRDGRSHSCWSPAAASSSR